MAGISAQLLIDVAPPPGFTRLDAAHHRVGGLLEVAGRVPPDGRVTASDVPAGEAEAKMHPAGAVPETLLAGARRSRDRDAGRRLEMTAVSGWSRRRAQLVIEP